MNDTLRTTLAIVIILALMIILFMICINIMVKPAPARITIYSDSGSTPPSGTYVEKEDIYQEEAYTEEDETTAYSHLKLIATSVSDDEAMSIASIKNLITQKIEMVRINDKVYSWEVVDIDSGEVRLKNNDQYVTLMLESDLDQDAIKVLSPTERLIDRIALAKEIGSVKDALRSVSVAPSFKTNGVKLAKIKDDKLRTLAEKAGVKEGDIITKVNDCKVGNFWGLFNIYRKVRKDNEVTVNIRRDGKDKKMVYLMDKR